MGPTVYLHIGTPKCGSSYLQGRLSANRPAVAEQGVYWAQPWDRQVRAARNVRALRPGQQLQPNDPWCSLARDILDWNGSAAIVSMEWLVRCQVHQIEAAVASLAPARVEVVCVARDLARTVPAAWQEATQNFRTWTWDTFLEAITGDRARHPACKEFWGQHDLAEIFRRWSAALPVERLHLVTIPPAGRGHDPELLWQRFCAVVGLDGSSFAQPPRDNASLGVASAQVMRRMNAVLREQGFSRSDYTRTAKHVLGKQVLPGRRQQEGQIGLPDDVVQWLSDRSRQMLTELEELPIDVVGDVSELNVNPAAGRDPNSVSDAELVEAAVAALAGLVTWTARREKQSRAEGSGEASVRRRAHDRERETAAATEQREVVPGRGERVRRMPAPRWLARRVARAWKSRRKAWREAGGS